MQHSDASKVRCHPLSGTAATGGAVCWCAVDPGRGELHQPSSPSRGCNTCFEWRKNGWREVEDDPQVCPPHVSARKERREMPVVKRQGHPR
ncbi:hypothetical protein BS78_07G171600 [Paspalum vaginatum]|nr:hypothetical protein BS78_07G171600 [Paspalum vaginatum]